MEKRFLRKDGQMVWAWLTVSLVRLPEGVPPLAIAMVEDITERRKLEQQALRAQRMKSIGTLAGGIAHDLNNVLGPIIMSLDLLKMKFPDPDSEELFSIIRASAQHGADMVRQVLSFACGVEGRRMELQIKHLVLQLEKIVNETFLKNIQVRTIIPHNLWTVLGDPTQIHQVLLNLCVNARDAMPTGGALTISAENLTLDAHYAGLKIAIVLTDMTMPIMDGPEMILVLRKMNPAVRIIGASGLSAAGHGAQAASLGVEHFLHKPYTAETLLKTLRQVLSREP